MKISFKKHFNDGQVLLTALVMAATVGIGIGSYLKLVSEQNKSVTRSLVWNRAMPVAESGIEEAMTELYYGGTNVPAKGWNVTNGVYTKQRSIGTNGNYYIVKIEPGSSNKPVITATGYAVKPLTESEYLARKVQVKASKAPAPKGGIVARGSVSFSGGAYLDSFDSSDPNFSTLGLYDPTKRKDNGQVVANSGSISVVGNPTGGIYGYAQTGPTGTTSATGGAKVGDMAFMTSLTTSGVEAGHSANDANVDFAAVPPPSSSGTYSPSGGVYNGTNYDYLLQNANYYTSVSMSLTGSKILAVVGNVTLYVNSDFSMSGLSLIYLYPGSSLKLYVNGALSIGGGGIVNGTGKASNLSVYGLNTTAQTWSYTGTSTFIGTVYAPNSDFKFSGISGASGSFTANTVTVTGTAGVHYDESLSSAFKGYIVSSWNEL